MSEFMDCYDECRILHGPAYCLRDCRTNKPRPPPTSMKTLIYRATGCPMKHIHVGDPYFKPIPRNDMVTFLEHDKTDLEEYKETVYDCNNFACRLRAAAQSYFGRKGINAAICELWAPALLNGKIVNHGFNGYVEPSMIFYPIEPQTDDIFTVASFLRGSPSVVIM